MPTLAKTFLSVPLAALNFLTFRALLYISSECSSPTAIETLLVSRVF